MSDSVGVRVSEWRILLLADSDTYTHTVHDLLGHKLSVKSTPSESPISKIEAEKVAFSATASLNDAPSSVASKKLANLTLAPEKSVPSRLALVKMLPCKLQL